MSEGFSGVKLTEDLGATRGGLEAPDAKCTLGHHNEGRIRRLPLHTHTVPAAHAGLGADGAEGGEELCVDESKDLHLTQEQGSFNEREAPAGALALRTFDYSPLYHASATTMHNARPRCSAP